MNPELLKTFLAVCKHMNFTRAAPERFLTQPAVSRQMRHLERELGVKLFEQLGKSLHLTDAGLALAPQAAQLLGQMERVAEAVRGYGGPERGRLRIGASTTPGYYLLPPILGEFHRCYPEVELQYVVENSLGIEQRIVRNELDIAFVGARVMNPALQIQPVLEDEIVCFCGKSHPCSRRKKMHADALRDELWVIREKGSATRELFERRLKSIGIKMARVIELSSLEGIKALVGAGIGVSFMSAHGLRREFGDRQLHALAVNQLRLRRPIYAIRHADKHESPVMKAFLELVREHTLASSKG